MLMIGIDDTICARATASGHGAITVIRVSGPESFVVVDRCFRPADGIPLVESRSWHVKFGQFYRQETLVDEVLVTLFRAPRSYTGENSVEISCHGSEYIAQQILETLLDAGARLAEGGEFTRRAFLNGKMDLAQAEAVADVIASETAAAHRVALQQMRGGFSDELGRMRGDLLQLVSLMELELDFSEEEVEFADRSQLVHTVGELTTHVRKLIKSFALGNVIKNGVPVAIAGATNTGKSTLLNALLGEERAIVSSIHGTTRDTIEETLNIDGITFRFIDTAGIRNTTETIEIIGIERTYTKIRQAAVVLMVLDAERPEYFDEGLQTLASRIDGKHQQVIVLLNKIDTAETKVGAAETMDAVAAGAKAAVAEGSKDDAAETLAADAVAAVAGVENDAAETKAALAAGSKDDAAETLAADAVAAVATGSKIAVYLQQIAQIAQAAGITPLRILPLAAKSGQGIDALREVLSHSQTTLQHTSDATLVTNLRHYEALQEALQALERVKEGLQLNIPTDLVAQDIREAIHYIGTITGTITTDEVLGNIFGKFCIGK